VSKLLLPQGSEGASKPSRTITKESIEARLELLKKEVEQVKGALAAYTGAIQDCEHWLKELSNGR